MKKKLLILCLVLILSLSLVLTGCAKGPEVTGPGEVGAPAAEKLDWRLASTWADGTFLFEVDKSFCANVSYLTNGNFKITPYAVGQLGDANQVFDLVRNGTVQVGGDWPSYWTGKSLGFDLLATTMYNFSGWDYYVWIYEGGGFEDAYNYMFNQYDMMYFPTAVTQMESGIRSNVPINTISDLKGMKVRFAGKIQGMVAEKIGITPTTVAANEIYEALQRGVIDAAEYSGPYNDDILKIQEVADYWLAPGWHQTASAYGAMVNMKVYNELSDEYKEVLKKAADLTFIEYMAKYTWNDALATQRILDYGVEVTSLPEDEMALIEGYVLEAMEELAIESEDYAHVLNSMNEYRKVIAPYRDALGKWGWGMNLKEYPAIP